MYDKFSFTNYLENVSTLNRLDNSATFIANHTNINKRSSAFIVSHRNMMVSGLSVSISKKQYCSHYSIPALFCRVAEELDLIQKMHNHAHLHLWLI